MSDGKVTIYGEVEKRYQFQASPEDVAEIKQRWAEGERKLLAEFDDAQATIVRIQIGSGLRAEVLEAEL